VRASPRAAVWRTEEVDKNPPTEGNATPRRRAEKRETTLSDDVSTAVVDAGEDVRGKK
jgi:hypothetical protein